MYASEKNYTEQELEKMTVSSIKKIASDRGYSITKTLKSDIISEFIKEQNGGV